MGMDKFFTREVANKGTKVPLYLPTGEKSDDWLMICGMDSDAARIAVNRIQRSSAELMDVTDEKELVDLAFQTKVRAAALLITDWSFEDKCTEENRIRLLTNAPHLVDAIDSIASNRQLFFAKQSSDSANTQSKSSDSTQE